MAELLDYLRWRADVPFSVAPFNDVDNLLLCELAYTAFDGIVPATGEEIPLAGAAALYFSAHPERQGKDAASFWEKAPLLMTEMLEGPRFGGMRLSRYINEVDRDRDEQISAVCYHLDDGTVFVAFRGTDSSLTGWKEDFNLSFVTGTPGQRRAAAYLDLAAGGTDAPLRVGGHSKGGNFAVYAACFCLPQTAGRILRVYSNDGPGFREDVTASPEYLAMLPRVVSIVPETSVIGRLLSSGSSHHVVGSSAAGIMQHDGFTWQVRRDRFAEAEFSAAGQFVQTTLRGWLSGLDDEARRGFTDTVFTLFSATGEEDFNSIGGQKRRSAEAMLTAMRGLPRDQQRELLRVLMSLLQSGGQTALAMLSGREAPPREEPEGTPGPQPSDSGSL